MASISLVCFPSLLPRLYSNSISNSNLSSNSNLNSKSNLNSNHLVLRKNFNYSSSNLKLQKEFNGVFSCSTTSGKEVIGGKTEIVIGGKTEIKDVKANNDVQKLGKFSVEEFNQKYKIFGPLTFSEVVEAQQQLVASDIYYLKISTKQNGIEKLFDAVVWVHLPVEQKPIELLSFIPSTN